MGDAEGGNRRRYRIEVNVIAGGRREGRFNHADFKVDGFTYFDLRFVFFYFTFYLFFFFLSARGGGGLC